MRWRMRGGHQPANQGVTWLVQRGGTPISHAIVYNKSHRTSGRFQRVCSFQRGYSGWHSGYEQATQTPSLDGEGNLRQESRLRDETIATVIAIFGAKKGDFGLIGSPIVGIEYLPMRLHPLTLSTPYWHHPPRRPSFPLSCYTTPYPRFPRIFASRHFRTVPTYIHIPVLAWPQLRIRL